MFNLARNNFGKLLTNCSKISVISCCPEKTHLAMRKEKEGTDKRVDTIAETIKSNICNLFDKIVF
jgi:hypothetical protein